MPIELKIPEVGESITEVQIAEWLKAEGDTVQKDDPLAVIDSEKTTFELPAPESGTLGRILQPAGATVKVGDVIAHLEPGGDATEHAASSVSKGGEGAKTGTKKTPAAAVEKKKPKGPADAVSDKTDTTEKRAAIKPTPPESDHSKSAVPDPAGTEMETAEDTTRLEASSVEPEAAETTNEEPVTKSAGKPPAIARKASSTTGAVGEEIVPMTMLRRTVARRLVEAKQQMAMLTTFNEVDMSAVKALRKKHQDAFEQRHGVKLGLMSFFVKAAVDALKQFPQLNAEVRGNDIVYRNYFNIGVAIATGRGLVVPVLQQAELLSFADVEKSIGDFADRAKDGKLKPDDLDGATFTITNGGVFGSLLSTPIINPPQSGILGMHTIQDRPVAVDDQVVIRPMMYLALTYDHRIVDGREAVLFIRRIKEAVESPARMLLEI